MWRKVLAMCLVVALLCVSVITVSAGPYPPQPPAYTVWLDGVEIGTANQVMHWPNGDYAVTLYSHLWLPVPDAPTVHDWQMVPTAGGDTIQWQGTIERVEPRRVPPGSVAISGEVVD